MLDNLLYGLRTFLIVVSQILTAGIAITAFSILLYALAFNLRDQVARSFALILICIVISFSADAIGSITTINWEIEFWLKLQWASIIFLPATYLHFSNALLTTTGKPSKGKRTWAVRFCYLFSILFIAILYLPAFQEQIIIKNEPASHLEPTPYTIIFVLYYFGTMSMAWYNFFRSYQRTTTSTSRRRMGYLIIGALAPALGSFPYLVFGFSFAIQHSIIFWFSVVTSHIVVGGLIIIMAYSVAFFGVSWPDRIIKSRLFKWVMRGPVTASLTLGITTIVRRLGEAFGTSYSALVPITMVISILLIEYSITIFSPVWEQALFYVNDEDKSLALLKKLENKLMTKNDLKQFLEMILAAVCDRLQATGAYIATWHEDNLDFFLIIGESQIDEDIDTDVLNQLKVENGNKKEIFQWENDIIIPLYDNQDNSPNKELLGLIGVSGTSLSKLDSSQISALDILTQRTKIAIRDRSNQLKALASLQILAPEMDMLYQMRAVSRFDDSNLLSSNEQFKKQDVAQWVKDALSHYWGGPKLTKSPLLKLNIVQKAIQTHDGNPANGLRAILKEAIDRTKPEGEHRFTGEWLLYNILEMKFLEGRKVREVALRLAMSEADLYRKQRVAVEQVAKMILEMESQIAPKQNINDNQNQ